MASIPAFPVKRPVEIIRGQAEKGDESWQMTLINYPSRKSP